MEMSHCLFVMVNGSGGSLCGKVNNEEMFHSTFCSITLTLRNVETESMSIPLSLRYDRKSMTVWMMSPFAILWAPVEAEQQRAV